MRKTEREKARAERDVWLFLGERTNPCQASGELTQPRRLGVLPLFSGPVNPAALPADGPTVGGLRKVSSSRWPPFLWLSGGKGGNYVVGIKWEYGKILGGKYTLTYSDTHTENERLQRFEYETSEVIWLYMNVSKNENSFHFNVQTRMTFTEMSERVPSSLTHGSILMKVLCCF